MIFFPLIHRMTYECSVETLDMLIMSFMCKFHRNY